MITLKWIILLYYKVLNHFILLIHQQFGVKTNTFSLFISSCFHLNYISYKSSSVVVSLVPLEVVSNKFVFKNAACHAALLS